MLQRIHRIRAEYPQQFWILFSGSFVNSVGGGMVFPFLTLYLHQHLNLSLTFVGVLFALWGLSSLLGQLAGGSLTDRYGRKALMAISLGINAVGIIGLGIADSLLSAAAVIILIGFIGSLFQPARDAMVADLIEPEKRAAAYALLRVVHNVGIAIGPAIGGFLAAQSYISIFVANAITTGAFFFITIIWLRETHAAPAFATKSESLAGAFAAPFRDTRFVVFCIGLSLVIISGAQMMTVLPVYMKDQFGLGESFFGWVMTTNATMVVLFQYAITRATLRLPRLPYIALGAIFYALGTASVALGNAFPHFVLAMAVTTVGEMILAPTSTSITADLAPAEMRGRYMGMLGLTWTIGFGIGPILGGFITDNFAPAAVWLLTSVAAVTGALIFLLLARSATARAVVAIAKQ
ncbi:MAG: MFS transporter [Chloroflexi bacterium]|nr:MFS transporter [Chloroflexota bacterium]